MQELNYMVKVSYPLKQGLKLVFVFVGIIEYSIVKVSYPLKQGLKPQINTEMLNTHDS